MTRSVSGRLAPLLSLLPLLLLPLSAFPQGEETQPAAPELTPSELYRDVRALRVVNELQLTRAQIEKILPVVQQVADQAVADAQADDAAYELVKQAAEVFVAALTQGQEPPQREAALLNEAAQERTAREEFRAGLAAQAAAQIQRILTREQAARIETAAEGAERKALAARLEGAASPLDYIVMKLDQQLELMPDEFLRTREQRASDMATAILGKGAPRVRALAGDLLNVMNQVASWTPAQYAQNRPTLKDYLARVLGLPEAPGEHVILYDDFIAWITSERTPVVLRELLTVRAPEEEGVTP